METVTISKFKSTCLALLERVRRTGEPLLITRRGEPVAEVIPASPEVVKVAWLGSMRGTGEILSEVVSPAADEGDWEVLRS